VLKKLLKMHCLKKVVTDFYSVFDGLFGEGIFHSKENFNGKTLRAALKR
jgi:hypothetical protein